MAGLADWLESQRPRATQDFALGAERFAQMLRDTEMVDTPLAELEAIGRADLERNRRRCAKPARRYAPGATIPDCMARMNAQQARGRPGRRRAARSSPGLKQLPRRAGSRHASPAPRRRRSRNRRPTTGRIPPISTFPGPSSRGLPSVYYIAPPDPSWTPEVQAGFIPGEADLLFTSVHEVWPGHFLNFLHANRSPFLFGRVFVGYAFAEGWAHYTEEMMWDAGLGNGDPEIHIGQLSNALLRDCRFLSAIGMHTGRMTMEQSRRMFREQCFQDEGNARQQAARGTYDPAYLNYTMGKLMIRRLRDDWTASRGGRRGVEGVPRPLPELWRPADPAGAAADDGGRRGKGGVLGGEPPSPLKGRGLSEHALPTERSKAISAPGVSPCREWHRNRRTSTSGWRRLATDIG